MSADLPMEVPPDSPRAAHGVLPNSTPDVPPDVHPDVPPDVSLHIAPNPQAVQRLLGGDTLAALRQRLRRAYARVPPGAESPPLRLSGLAPHEAAALQDLTGRPTRAAASMGIDMAALSARLRAAGLASGLRAALEVLDGPIAPSSSERMATAQAWAGLARQPHHPALAPLLAGAQGLGLLKRLAASSPAKAQRLCDAAARVLHALPAHGWPRARLAATLLGNAHALDRGQPVATLVLAALRQAARVADAPAPTDDAADDSARALWAAQGVAVNELARPALSLNLPVRGMACDGEPRYWSLRQLLREPPAWAVAGRDVFVCENPNLLAICADALGPRCAPLLCTDGMPAAAQRTLLRQLCAAGAQLHYHGDFDWPGIAIANRVLHDFGARPWCFGAADYLAAVAVLHADVQGPLHGNPVAASWDAALTAAMAGAQCAIAEESMADGLVAHLAGLLGMVGLADLADLADLAATE